MSQRNRVERNKHLTELLGDCWHEWSEENGLSQKVCRKCDAVNWKFVEGGAIEVTNDNYDFSEWEAFAKLKDWIDSHKWARYFWFEFFGFLDHSTAPKLTPDHASDTSARLSPDSLADHLFDVLSEGRVWLRSVNRE